MVKKNFLELQTKYWRREKLKYRRAPSHPVVREYVCPKIAAIRRHINIDSNTTLLDVGCGNGFFSYYFDQICYTFGIDFSKQMIVLNPIRNKAVMDAEKIGIKDNSYDIVFCHALLHHVNNIDLVIQEMKRVSKRYIVILEPNRSNPLMFLFSLLVKEERRAMRFSLNYLKSITSLNNLDIISAFSFGMIVPNKTPIMTLPFVRLLNFNQPFGMTNFIIAKKI